MIKKLAMSNVSNYQQKRDKLLVPHDQYSFYPSTHLSLFMTGIPTRTSMIHLVVSLLSG